MGTWIAILLTLAAVGSVLWGMPSPREKSLSRMRQEAMRLGLKVRLLDQKTANNLFPWLEEFHGYVLYEKYFRAGQQKTGCKFHVIRLNADEEIHEIDRNSAARQYLDETGLLENLPQSTEALFCFADGIALLWREKEIDGVIVEVEKCLAEFMEANVLWKEPARS